MAAIHNLWKVKYNGIMVIGEMF